MHWCEVLPLQALLEGAEPLSKRLLLRVQLVQYTMSATHIGRAGHVLTFLTVLSGRGSLARSPAYSRRGLQLLLEQPHSFTLPLLKVPLTEKYLSKYLVRH